MCLDGEGTGTADAGLRDPARPEGRFTFMDENQDKEAREKEPVRAGKKEEKLPYCTAAASAEHAGGAAEEEPCDDGRTGDYERE